MPSVITHAFIGAGGAALAYDSETPKRFFYFSLICSILPDADLIMHMFGYGFNDFLGHNGFFHSLLFAFFLSFTTSFIFFRINGFLSKSWWKYFIYFLLLLSSHTLLDAMIKNDPGTVLLWPYDDAKMLLPQTPLEPSPLGIKDFLGGQGWIALKSELYYIWAPLAGLIILFRGPGFVRKRFE